jgi:hypothetical protein
MKMSILNIVLLFIIVFYASSQEIIQQKIIPPLLNFKIGINYVSITNSNGIILTYGDIVDNIIIKIDSNFSTEWSYQLDSSSYAYLLPFATYLIQNNNLTYSFLSLKLQRNLFEYGQILKLDLTSSGDSIRINNYDSLSDIYGTPYFYSLDHGAFIYSYTDAFMSNPHGIYFVKIDSNANEIWNKKLNDSTNQVVGITRPVRTFDSGFIFLASQNVEPGYSISILYVIKTDSECNELLRNKIDLGKYSIYLFNKIIIPVKNGGYVFTTSLIDTTNNNIYIGIIKLNDSLKMEWMKLYQSEFRNIAYDIISNDNGDLFVLGVTSQMKHNILIDSLTQIGYLLKLNTQGDKIWDMKLGRDSVYNDFKNILYAGNNEYYCVGVSNDSLMLIKIRDNPTDVKENEINDTFNDLQISPNPFSSSFNISFTNRTASAVSIDLYDILGNKIYQKSLGFHDSGTHQAMINPGCDLSPGFYVVTVRCGADIQYLKVLKGE